MSALLVRLAATGTRRARTRSETNMMVSCERIFEWLAEKLAPYLMLELQIGGHCGLCGKWVPDVIVERRWSWTICPKCASQKEAKL